MPVFVLLIVRSPFARPVSPARAAATDVQLTDWLVGPSAAAVSAVSAALVRAGPAPRLSRLAMHPLRTFHAARPVPAAQLQLAPLPGRPIRVDTAAARTALQVWEAAMSEKLERFKRYPEDSRERHEQDTVSLRITVSRSGRVLRVAVLHSRGFTLLDQEALRMVQQAAPLPPLPEELSGDRINVIVPVEFFLLDGVPLSGDLPR
jgi:protein TonB